MNKKELLYELAQETFIALQPSAVHGIGVFAICDIPKGCKSLFSKNNTQWIELSFEEVAALPEHSKNFIETYYLYNDTHYYIPEYGCKVMDMANYLNHSSDPNIRSVDEGAYFEAIREIKTGEELLVDYGEIVNGTEGYL